MYTSNIDIVIPWLNPNDTWYNSYAQYSGRENPGRIRYMGTFKYLLRSIAENLPWINCVYVVLFDESQKPSWLNESDRLKVIYHREFIPHQFLPNFNSLVVDMFLCHIKSLSDSYIFLNDDMFFLKPLPSSHYFENGIPVHHPSMHEGVYKKYNDAQFRYIEENNYNFVNKVAGKQVLWSTRHLPIPFSKSFQQFIWQTYSAELWACMNDSPIRSNKNLCNWVFYGLEEIYNHCIIKDLYSTTKCTCFDLADGMTYDQISTRIKDKYIACLNDGDFLSIDYDSVKQYVLDILDNLFPNKCQYELL